MFQELLHPHFDFACLRKLHHGLHHCQYVGAGRRLESDGPNIHALHGVIEPSLHGHIHGGVSYQVVRDEVGLLLRRVELV